MMDLGGPEPQPNLIHALSTPDLEVYDLGLRDYQAVWHLQQHWVALRAEHLIPDRLILVEHPAVLTAGRKFKAEHLLQPDLTPLFQIERGGDISFHEPGQIVAYPLFYLANERRHLRAFLRGLETVLIEVLSHFGLQARRDEEHTGVWIEERKIASIGIAVRRWVTYHGLALNVSNNLQLTRQIKPCGFDGGLMTSLAAENKMAPMDSVKIELIQAFQRWWLDD